MSASTVTGRFQIDLEDLDVNMEEYGMPLLFSYGTSGGGGGSGKCCATGTCEFYAAPDAFDIEDQRQINLASVSDVTARLGALG